MGKVRLKIIKINKSYLGVNMGEGMSSVRNSWKVIN